eukprot:3180042-Amphidinium_carterae.1
MKQDMKNLFVDVFCTYHQLYECAQGIPFSAQGYVTARAWTCCPSLARTVEPQIFPIGSVMLGLVQYWQPGTYHPRGGSAFSSQTSVLSEVKRTQRKCLSLNHGMPLTYGPIRPYYLGKSAPASNLFKTDFWTEKLRREVGHAKM